MSKSTKVERVNFGRLPETVEMPNLMEVQLTPTVPSSKRASTRSNGRVM